MLIKSRNRGLISLNILVVLFITFGNSYAQKPEETIFNKGKEYYKKQMYDQAIVEFTKVIKINPNDCAEAYVHRGLAYVRKSDLAQAVSDYSMAIRIKADYVKAYVFRGRAYGAMGDFERAFSEYKKAMGIDPNNGEIFYNRAKTFFLKKDYDKCWEDVHKAEALGDKVDTAFIEVLKKASGRVK